ncbi:response regulator receiver protein [Burkholderia pseudomallei]|uniref:helix-turn-helix domain-containing protein n=1 Tax=Burkholderia pseudomallei TaxID=28450 RepID=UPI000F0733F3|nr:helix-turn-helix domain-containing protein [Burkholderia pseudomallei]VBW17814.1 response regulator receiver protein [Burkholderia pseudomallei]
MANEAITTDSLAVAERVRELMTRHGIGKRQQTTELCRILDLSFSQGHRKLRGSSPWTLAQIKKVAEAYGEPAAQLFGAQALDPGMVGACAREAVLYAGIAEIACTAWIGGLLDAGARPEFVAYEQQGRWRVLRHTGVLYQNAYDVHKIEIYPRRAESDRLLVAVIDADSVSADEVCRYLDEQGFVTARFGSVDAFADALQGQAFDAVVTEWMFDGRNAADAIQAVRASDNPGAPIFVLTGDLLTGRASEAEISEVIRVYDVVCYEKPARMAILSADLAKRLSRA